MPSLTEIAQKQVLNDADVDEFNNILSQAQAWHAIEVGLDKSMSEDLKSAFIDCLRLDTAQHQALLQRMTQLGYYQDYSDQNYPGLTHLAGIKNFYSAYNQLAKYSLDNPQLELLIVKIAIIIYRLCHLCKAY